MGVLRINYLESMVEVGETRQETSAIKQVREDGGTEPGEPLQS